MKQWSSNNFNKGLNTKDNPAMLGLNELSEATNAVVEDGKLKFREGYSDKSSIAGYTTASGIHGLVEYNDTATPANNKMIYALGTDLKTGATVLDSDINATNYVNFSKFTNNESLYYVDGEHAVKSQFSSSYTYAAYITELTVDADQYIPYIYVKNGVTYALTSRASTKALELWKIVNGVWVFDKNIYAAAAGNYSNFCYDGTYYYAHVLGGGSIIAKFSDAGFVANLAITDGVFTPTLSKYTKTAYYNNHLYITTSDGANSRLIKVNTTTGYKASFVIGNVPTLHSVFNINTDIYFGFIDSGGNNSIRYVTSLDDAKFTLADSLTTGIIGCGTRIKNNIVTDGNGYPFVYDFSFNIVNIIDYYNPGRFASNDNNIEDIYHTNPPADSDWFKYYQTSLTNLNEVYSPITFVDYPINVTISATASGLFRTGDWYFAYRIATLNTISKTYTYSALSSATIVNISAVSNVTLLIDANAIPNTTDFIIWYGRHSTESYFYVIGSNTLPVITPTALLLSQVYDETTVYTPPPVGTTQIMSYRDMMIYVKDNSLYFSNYFDPINCPTTIATDTASGLGGYYPIGKENNAITGIYQLHGYLFVFKSHYTYLISGDPGELATFRIDLISDKVGAKNERCITDDGSFIYVYCDSGIYPINENGVGKSLTEYVDSDVLANYATSGYDHALCYHQKLNRLMLLERP